MIWTSPSRRRRTEARPAPAMMAAQSALIIGRLGCVTQNTNLSFELAQERSRGPRGAFLARSPQLDRRGHETGAVPQIASPRGLRSRRRLSWRCRAGRAGVVHSEPGAQRAAVFDSGETPFFQLLLLGWIGVGLGRLTIKATPRPAESVGPAKARGEPAERDEKVDRVLRQVAKVLQAHLTDSDSFSERLDGHNQRLSRHESVGPIKEIVLALIEDNRDMRDRLDNVRNQLEESRLQVVHLQTNLERAEEAGLRDVVTAIGNRRFFDASFMEEVEKARRLGDHMCLALADIDKFKHVNDRFGHLVGDRLLRLFANILVQNVRGQDKVARFGGEEFALIFPGARLGEAVTAVERIRVVLESKQWTIEPSGERISKVTASFGVAKLRADESPNDLLRASMNASTRPRSREGTASWPMIQMTKPPNRRLATDAPRRADPLARSRDHVRPPHRCVSARPRRGGPEGPRAGRQRRGLDGRSPRARRRLRRGARFGR